MLVPNVLEEEKVLNLSNASGALGPFLIVGAQKRAILLCVIAPYCLNALKPSSNTVRTGGFKIRLDEDLKNLV